MFESVKKGNGVKKSKNFHTLCATRMLPSPIHTPNNKIIYEDYTVAGNLLNKKCVFFVYPPCFACRSNKMFQRKKETEGCILY